MISGFIAGYRSLQKMLNGCREYFKEVFRKKEVMHVVKDFCAEVAVLVAVFPILEFVIGRRAESTPQSWSFTGVAVVSGSIVVLFFVLAVIIADKWG